MTRTATSDPTSDPTSAATTIELLQDDILSVLTRLDRSVDCLEALTNTRQDLGLAGNGQHATKPGPGSPGNIAAIGALAEAWTDVEHQSRRIVRALHTAGVCPLEKPPAHTGRAFTDLTWWTRGLIIAAPSPRLLRSILATLEHTLERVDDTVDGNPRTPLGTCPNCELDTLVAYHRDGIIRCEQDRPTRTWNPCICADPVCHCKRNPDRPRHIWDRATGGWDALATRIAITNAAKEPRNR